MLLKLIASKFIQKDIYFDGIEIKSQYKDDSHLLTFGSFLKN